MLWRGRRQSGNVDDRRGFSGKGIVAGGGVLGAVIYLLSLFLGGDPSQMPQVGMGSRQLTAEEEAADEERAKFVKVVLAETEDVWHAIFRKEGKEYSEPVLVLFRDVVQSACGTASSASGPFYCPANQQVYIDLSFFEEMQQRFRVAGDFPMAYVLAHEVGHHVQNLLGISDKMHQLRQQLNEKEYNRYSVMLELQADFFAGVWARHAHQMDTILEAGDIEEALMAASSVGDDRIQKQTKGYIVPDAFTHGTSEQRMHWFKKGFETGDIRQGDTFAAAGL
jgi:uncharacterized protein